MFKLITITLATVIGLGVTQASAENRNFRLANRSNNTITEVMASNIGDFAFVPVDLLGDETIGPNHSLVIALLMLKVGVALTFSLRSQTAINRRSTMLMYARLQS